MMTKTLLGVLLKPLGKNWKALRYFAFYNRTIFEILFLTVYTAEQALLIYLLSLLVTPPSPILNIVSYFALIVLFTFGLHKFLMESRIKVLESEMIELKSENDYLSDLNEQLIKRHENLDAYLKEGN
tara:strand:+ start:2028 stop:2408 length:381 start_codon:yes stop_codon:yes gene_type:complete